ncbi:tyrosine-type recombinase/integrase [Nevskia ramosa]|uniref:tyrosine-type recombinase/integrase n=1 Tax=Nevskia ramosa TaxID=64002 RepID=UPI0003B33FB1|nr:site-specific integrase [Nevskia ramosa]
MPRIAKELRALEVERLKTPGTWSVGTVPGLYLQVKDSGARSWVLRASIGGRRREMGLGGYPAVKLAGAIERARKERLAIDEGIDPVELRARAQASIRNEAAERIRNTFKEAAADYIKAHRAGWKNAKHAAQWESTLTEYAFPVIGNKVVWEITNQDVLAILDPIWTTKTETANRVRNRIELVIASSMVRAGRTGQNPARWRGNLQMMLPKPTKVTKKGHFEALPVHEVGGFMVRLRTAKGVAARAMEFTILTATRTTEVRGAIWGEIDFENACWTIPAERMKAEREHRVPLTSEAIDLLKTLPRGAATDAVFRSPRGEQLSGMAMLMILRRMGVDATVHGFRSTFRDWAGELTAYPREVAELALAHRVGDATEGAYARGDLFVKRRNLMADWAGFLNADLPPSAR